MKQIFHYLIVLTFILMSCKGNNPQSESSGENLVFDTISITIDYPYLSNYYQTSSCISNGNILWSGYNHMLHSIDIFDITNKKVHEVISLEKEGPNGIYDINNYIFNDSLIVFSDYQNDIVVFSLSDRKVLKRFNPTVNTNYQSTYIGMLSEMSFSPVKMGFDGQSLVFPIYPIKGPMMSDTLAMSLNLTTEKVSGLPLSYPDEMKNRLGKYGGMTYVSLVNYSDRVLYNFPYSSKVYVYWKEKGLVETISMNSKETANESSLMKASKREYRKIHEYESGSLRFMDVYYSKTYDKYVRVHHDAVEKDGGKRKSFIITYDCKTGKTKEFRLPDSFSFVHFFAEDNLYFLLKNSSDDVLLLAEVYLKNV